MKTIVQEMVEKYEPKNNLERRNAVKEVMQELILYSLSKNQFFKDAAFYGGTALRIFYGLDRFSEDLDFSLLNVDSNFDLNSFLPGLTKEMNSFGLNVDVELKDKTNESAIASAFMKAETVEHLLIFYPDEHIQGINREEKIKIKIEVDINPPKYATYEIKFRLLPSPYEIRLYDQSSLFAGKIHAVLHRSWQSRVKGRDMYDYAFYLSRRTPVNLEHLRQRLIQSNFITEEEEFSLIRLKQLLGEKLLTIDYSDAKKDVLPFINDASKINLWSSDFFIAITNELQSI